MRGGEKKKVRKQSIKEAKGKEKLFKREKFVNHVECC